MIAIVDDDMSVRDALGDLLQVSGLSGRTYASAPAFLADYAPGRFDLLITDLRMPDMDGFALLRELRAIGAALPAIVVTSASDAATQKRAIGEGASAILSKPVAKGILLPLIDSLLSPDGEPARVD